MVFAFIVGLTGILTGLEVPVLEAAAQAVGPGLVDCQKIAFMMVDTQEVENSSVESKPTHSFSSGVKLQLP